MLYILFEKGFSYFKPKIKPAVISISLLFGILNANAQKPIGLKAALDTAVKNNISLQIAKTNVQYYQQITKSSFDAPKTAIGFDYGKFNSLENDNKFSVVQTLDFPTVYARQFATHKTNLRISEIEVDVRQLDLKTEVKSAYYNLLLLNEKQKLLLWADSVYSAFLDKSNQRFKSGDVDLLELRTAENQKQQISNQLELLKTDNVLMQNRFKFLLNTDETLQPRADSLLYSAGPLFRREQINHPLLKLGEEQLVLARQQKTLEKSKLMPTLSFGYNNSSIIGWQTNSIGAEQYFDKSKRFSSVSVGVGIPIFFGAQNSRIKANGILIQQREKELALTKKTLDNNLTSAVERYTRLEKLISSYQKIALRNAADIVKTASDKLNAGEIAYLDWVILVNQSIQLKVEYYDKVQQFNEAAFEIERITVTDK